MHALVVYESMFGNTRDVAYAIGDGLAAHGEVDVVEVGATDDHAPQVDLLVIGGPTHMFGMSRPTSREDAAGKTKDATVSMHDGIREWLERADPARSGASAAAFDTKIDKPFLPGSAAHAAQKRLRKLGYRIPVHAESFHVTDTMGPLASGELERARAWGDTLGAAISRDAPMHTR